ncbi:MAG: type II toxin-antitoxin system HicA family toxin [Chloroflexi bacterium]|nr:type II toxin-antitoxin system HicA family toxin [Chloroflexota bacterium]
MRYYCGVDRQELRRRIAQRAKAVRFSELQRLLQAYGWTLDRVAGSHYIFRRAGQKLPVPYRRPHVLRAYVDQALRLTEGEDDDDN